MKNLLQSVSYNLFIVIFIILVFSCSNEEDLKKDTPQEPDTWIVQANFDQSLHKVQFISDDIGFALGETKIYKTTDAGKSWSAIPNLAATTILDMHVVNENVIGVLHVAAGERKLAITTNGGNIWTLKTTPSQTVTKIYFISSTIGFAWNFVPSFNVYDSEFESYRTADGGATWTKMKNTSDQVINPVNFLFTSTMDGYASFGDFNPYLYTTTDGGITWNQGSYFNGLITSIKGQENDLCLISKGLGGDEINISSDAITWEYIGPNPYGGAGLGAIGLKNDLIFYVDGRTKILKYIIGASSFFTAEVLPTIRTGSNTSYDINDIILTDNYAYAVGSRPDATGGEKSGFVLKYKQ